MSRKRFAVIYSTSILLCVLGLWTSLHEINKKQSLSTDTVIVLAVISLASVAAAILVYYSAIANNEQR